MWWSWQKPGASLLVCVGLLTTGSRVEASPYDVYGAGARGSAMGSAQTAVADGPEALWYNPAQMATSSPGLAVGLMSTFGSPRIVLKERPPGYDVPPLGPPSTALGSELTGTPADTEPPSPLVGLNVGVVQPLLFEGFIAGFSIFLPIPDPVTLQTRYADERERYFSNELAFERIGSKVHHLDLQFGVAYEVTRWLAIGIGASYLPGFGVDTRVYLPDATDQERADVAATIETENGFGLLAGASFDLPRKFRVGISFRDATALRLRNDNDIEINGVTDGEPLRQEASWTPIYTPARAALGLARSFDALTIAADVRYTFWDTYEDAQGDPAGFRRVLSGAVGIEYDATPSTHLRAGAGFEPSPVPEQVGRTNYVDNDRVHLSLGAGHDFVLGTTAFSFAWYVRAQALLTRETFKRVEQGAPPCAPGVTVVCDEVPDDLVDPSTDRPFPEARGLQTGNPGFPGFVAGGWLGSLGVELRY